MTPKIAAAFLAASREIKTIAKDATNPHFKSKYASLDAIIEAVRPTLHKHGLAVMQSTTAPDRDESGRVTAFTLVTTLLHESGESLTSNIVMPLAKADPQGAGGALTYARRYGLAAMLCLATEEDDDAHRASQRDERADTGNRFPPKKAGDRIVPFGKTKGKKLSELTDEQLTGFLAWMTETDAKKFADLIGAVEEVLEDRREPAVA